MFQPNLKDIGRRVIYTSFGNTEEGILKSYNNERKVAVVVYHWNNELNNYDDYNGAMTNYSDLKFKDENHE